MLQHGSEEQRVDSLVSEMVEKFLGKYDVTKKKPLNKLNPSVEVKNSLKKSNFSDFSTELSSRFEFQLLRRKKQKL